jgi:hypothetical protein
VKITISNIIGNEKLSGLLMNFLYFNLTVEFIGLFFGKLLKTRKIFTKICSQKEKVAKLSSFLKKTGKTVIKSFPLIMIVFFLYFSRKMVLNINFHKYG